MEFTSFIIKFLILTAIVTSFIIFFLRRSLISSTEGAVKRLNDEIAKANTRQQELSEKIRKADEELTRRQEEAKQLAEKMRADAEEASKAEREKIIGKAREEGEEIIAKAQNSKEKIREELEKELETKAINCSVRILNTILSQNAKGAFDEVLVDEFLEGLESVDMSRISSEIATVDVVSIGALKDDKKTKISKIVEKKLGRKVAVNPVSDENIGGGVILKFGSMTLDGSIRNMIREAGVELQEKVEEGV